MQKWLRAALKLATDQSISDTCSAHKIFLLSYVLYFWWSLIIVEVD